MIILFINDHSGDYALCQLCSLSTDTFAKKLKTHFVWLPAPLRTSVY